VYPSLYQINTRVWLTERSRELGRPATLDDVPNAELDRLARPVLIATPYMVARALANRAARLSGSPR
jgi:hypothetical protein